MGVVVQDIVMALEDVEMTHRDPYEVDVDVRDVLVVFVVAGSKYWIY